MRQLTSLDAQFLAVESPRAFGHVSGFAVYDPSTAPGGEITIGDVCRLVGERLHMLPPFRRKLVTVPLSLDHPYWVDDPDFDLDFHIREAAVPPPGDERQVAEVVARICARPLDRAHPLWELYLVHGLEHGHVALLTKVHHAAIDGVSGAEILSILLDVDPGGGEIPPAPEREPGEPIPSQLEMLARGLIGLPRQMARAAATLPRTLPNLEAIPGVEGIPVVSQLIRVTSPVRGLLGKTADGEVLGDKPSTVPRTRFNGRVSAHRRWVYGSLPLDRIKAIKSELGLTVNDVVVGICAGALRQFLIDLDELPPEPLVAMVPVSVRTREQEGTFGNQVSAMFIRLPTDEPDPRKRLERAHEAMRAAKERHSALPGELMQDFTQFIPPAIHARASRLTIQLAAGSLMRPALNVVISNVPGPRMPLYFAGAELVANYPISVILDGVGLNITCLSYRDRVDFGIVVDRDMVDDAWPIMDDIKAELEELDELVCGRKAAPV